MVLIHFWLERARSLEYRGMSLTPLHWCRRMTGGVLKILILVAFYFMPWLLA